MWVEFEIPGGQTSLTYSNFTDGHTWQLVQDKQGNSKPTKMATVFNESFNHRLYCGEVCKFKIILYLSETSWVNWLCCIATLSIVLEHYRQPTEQGQCSCMLHTVIVKASSQYNTMRAMQGVKQAHVHTSRLGFYSCVNWVHMLHHVVNRAKNVRPWGSSVR